ncbi:photosynthetic reaction center subunit H [Polymorphobacter multimanifer]|uniref:Photosynthetic reaction center H subunit n=1 Tax=Polymorphobacter multimanifer TaxID=1070431 RepID=A0A841L8F7_9SPHN|nr:photosynthetic reaction center subunit H [Polymorphobacter multimanifer]MBB6227243.1 photosynthetic reaction center H subunit [Polymorphobacter multimanifer]GGI87651.1 photosynthetic reaction center subunit H [Polymorphobacter multimanifer]
MLSNVHLVGGLDIAELTLYLFFGFFLCLVWYLNRESRREGYPLEDDLSGEVRQELWRIGDDVQKLKAFQLPHGQGTVYQPAELRDPMPTNVLPRGWSGEPLDVVGDKLSSGVGPASYVMRADRPDMDMFGRPRIVPMRVDGHMTVEGRDTDPRGLPVIGLDGEVAGTISDLWVDRAEHIIRYYEVALTGGGTVTMPQAVARVKARHVHCDAILAAQFAGAPQLKSADQITLLEEEKVQAYFGAGYLWATEERAEPIL